MLLKTRHAWGLRPVDGVFREVAGHGTVTPAGEVSGVITVDQHPDITFTADSLQLDGELAVNRADFGLTWNFIGIAAMHNTLVVRTVFTRQ